MDTGDEQYLQLRNASNTEDPWQSRSQSRILQTQPQCKPPKRKSSAMLSSAKRISGSCGSFEVLNTNVENPLLVTSVLESLFAQLPLDDLKTCRLVCRLWKIEALRALRKQSCVNLSSRQKLQAFLKDAQLGEYNYNKFAFKFCDWNASISGYLSRIQCSKIEVDVNLFISKEHYEASVPNFEDLLVTQSSFLSKLIVNVDWAGTVRLVIPEKLLSLRFPQLKELVINNGHMEANWLHPLWVSILRNSPKLEILDLRNMNDHGMWKEVCETKSFSQVKELSYIHVSKTSVLKLHEQLLDYSLPVALRRLCLSFHDSNEIIITRILQKVAGSLETLEFYTQDESALSPIEFPTMPKLRILDAGNSQFSFPTITSEKFVKLMEIRATYWDWVYTFEELPDVHYYWRTDDPHHGITDLQLRFPTWSRMNFQYRRLENFDDFVNVISRKFPNLQNFTFHNVPVCDDVRRSLKRLAEVFEFSMKSFKIASYCFSEVIDASPCEISVTESVNQRRELKILDLGSKHWPTVWRSHPMLLSTVRDEWIRILVHFDNLVVLKLLWAKNVLSILKLTSTEVLPNLLHIEFVGNICVDRHLRAAVRQTRPNLRIVQIKDCYCIEEDWWYMNDPESDKVFENLFFQHRSLPARLYSSTVKYLGLAAVRL